MIVLPGKWRQGRSDADLFDEILNLQGEEYRNMDGRRTLRFEKDGNSYFAKLYSGIGWPRILKSLLSLRMPPVLSAANEWLAIKKLEKLGVATMTLVGYGEQGTRPAQLQSFIITEELKPTESLEDFCRDWKENLPSCQLKRALIEKLAKVSRQLHENGINHRDYYLCHFLLDISAGRDNIDPDNLTLSLIDLHRVQFRRKLPQRWRLKDLAGLYFSSMEIGLTQRDLYRFMKIYTRTPLRVTLIDDTQLWRQVAVKGEKMQERFYRKYS
ncbi:MAG: lipopolysaccharide core heptose(I) kinase RfaP [Thermodesulfobacteriota bacterium]|nr:lipopolysaccharide core heptose(I) kinase RfaP [Thermodesulfobacteriota bacterium]